MAEIPHAVLSEHFQEHMKGRRLVSAVFLTFRLDPAFFEQEVLPVFLDVPLSHAGPIKLVQLEDVLRTVAGSIAVYYDYNGLVAEAGSARLDVKRIALRHRTGIFHPKNVFILTEEVEPDQNGHRARTLLVSCLSANLTRAGWWENVEVCHTEEIGESDFTRLRDDLIKFTESLERRTGEKSSDGHAALRSIRDFLRKTEQRQQRSLEGLLHTHFFDGRTSVCDFLREVAGTSLQGMNLEVISPYFDVGPESKPLQDFIEQFVPREVRVFLPRKDTGEALCSPELFEWMRSQPGVSWGRLPKELLRRGKGEEVRQRFVHAKVYRFFTPQPKREILFIGSVNLTTPAHQTGGNLETGFLVELSPARKPEWWLDNDASRPRNFQPAAEDEGTSEIGGTRLSVRFWWNTATAEVFWDDAAPSANLELAYQGLNLFAVDPVPSRTWTQLPPGSCAELHRVLHSTSILTVLGDGKKPGLLLVQEEGMSHRPSLLFELSPAEILRYWSLLTVEQRTAFLEARAPDIALAGEGSALVARCAPLVEQGTLFDRFAGVFHAFGCLERTVREALRDGKEREATYRLFGLKYDSLGNLLTRVLMDDKDGKGDLIEHYVIALCARQLVNELRRENKEYWQEHVADGQRLHNQLDATRMIRERIVLRDPENMPAFLDWFDHWFLRRASPVSAEESL
jgi:hypothetical protein